MNSSISFVPTESTTHVKLTAYSASITTLSDPMFIGSVNQFAITAFWTGAGTGTFTLQGSTDVERRPTTADSTVVNWVTIGGSSQASSVGSPLLWNYSNVGYRWLRVVYTVATGTIILSVTVQLKGGL